MNKKTLGKDSLPMSLPENFDADGFLSKLGINRSDRYYNLKGSMYYVLDSLYQMGHSREWREYYDENGGYPLLSTELKKKLGNRYCEALDILEYSGVITRTTGFKIGEQSKLVSLTATYIASPTKEREFPKESDLRNKLIALKEEEKEMLKASLEKFSYITKWFDPARLTMDQKTVHALIEFYRYELEKRMPQEIPKHLTEAEIFSRKNSRANSMLDTMERFMNGDMCLRNTGKDHRLHSIITNTKKVLRTLYKYDSKPLVSIDIKASQPYFLNRLMKYENCLKEVQELIPELIPIFKGKKTQKLLSDILMFPTSPTTQYSKGFQSMSFCEILWTDDFYSKVVEAAEQLGEAKVFPNRDAVKGKMMQLLYDTGSYVFSNEAYQVFKTCFPKETALIDFFRKLSPKKHAKPTNAKKTEDRDEVKNYLAAILQRLESKLMLGVVARVISTELPEAPILPVHDCILTTQEYAQPVANIIRRELTNYIGIEPGLSIDVYDEQKTFEELGKLADRDMQKLLKPRRPGKGKKSKVVKRVAVPLKAPLLFELPSRGERRLLCSRYFDPTIEVWYEEDEGKEDEPIMVWEDWE